MEFELPNASTIIDLLTLMFLFSFFGFYNLHYIISILSMLESLSNITALLFVDQQPRIPPNERNPGCTMMAARRKEIKHIAKTEPHRLSRVPIRMFHSSHNFQIASSFREVWFDDKYQQDMLSCASMPSLYLQTENKQF